MFTGRIRGLEIARAPRPRRRRGAARVAPHGRGAEVAPGPDAHRGPARGHAPASSRSSTARRKSPATRARRSARATRSRSRATMCWGCPTFVGDLCDGCEKCVAICPGLAITLLDYRKDAAAPTVVIPYEFSAKRIKKGDTVTVLDSEGDGARQRRGDARPRAQGGRPRAARAGHGAGRHRAAHRRHPRAGTVAGRARRTLRAVDCRRRDRVPVRAGDGKGTARADPQRHPRHEPPEGGHAVRAWAPAAGRPART